MVNNEHDGERGSHEERIERRRGMSACLKLIRGLRETQPERERVLGYRRVPIEILYTIKDQSEPSDRDGFYYVPKSLIDTLTENLPGVF
ncbi:hypothetical protein HY212_02785 [Candidatus Pacearchaeota archaeon]|nr:hypothetical protein [Candidatus Pacearchaeota archaeon]